MPCGVDYEEAIIEAISNCPLLVLVLSTYSNSSSHVQREIQNACAEGSRTHIIPMRIDSAEYSKALRYYLHSVQWLDASAPPLERHLRRLVERVRAVLSMPKSTNVETNGLEDLKKRRRLVFVSMAALLLMMIVAVLGLAYFLSTRNEQTHNNNSVAIFNGAPPGKVNNIAPYKTPTPAQSPAPPSTSTATPTPAPNSDALIQETVEKALSNHKDEIKSVSVSVLNGVTLKESKVWRRMI